MKRPTLVLRLASTVTVQVTSSFKAYLTKGDFIDLIDSEES